MCNSLILTQGTPNELIPSENTTIQQAQFLCTFATIVLGQLLVFFVLLTLFSKKPLISIVSSNYIQPRLMPFLRHWSEIVVRFRSVFFVHDDITIFGFELSAFTFMIIVLELIGLCMRLHWLFYVFMYVLSFFHSFFYFSFLFLFLLLFLFFALLSFASSFCFWLFYVRILLLNYLFLFPPTFSPHPLFIHSLLQYSHFKQGIICCFNNFGGWSEKVCKLSTWVSKEFYFPRIYMCDIHVVPFYRLIFFLFAFLSFLCLFFVLNSFLFVLFIFHGWKGSVSSRHGSKRILLFLHSGV